MKRRVIAAVAAILLATVGAVLLLSYVAGADQRAMAGMQTVDVLVVAAPIAEGTPAEELAELVKTEALPARAVAPGTVSSLDQIRGRVATTSLQAGEQLLASRFIDPKSLEKSAEVKIPKGMHQVSLLLDSQRVLGGNLTPGATVGLFISLAATDRPGQTQLVLHKLLVSRVQGGLTPVPAEGGGTTPGTPAPLPAGSVMVTLVTNGPDAEKLIFGAENGSIWLSLEPADAPESGPRIVTGENVYK